MKKILSVIMILLVVISIFSVFTYEAGSNSVSEFELTSLIETPYADRGPSLLQDSTGKIWVFYASRSNSYPYSRKNIFYITSTDMGNTWSDEAELMPTHEEGPELDPSAGGPCAFEDSNGKIWVAWQRWTAPGSSDVYYTTSTDGGITWSSREVLVEYPGDDNNGCFIEVGGQVWYIFCPFYLSSWDVHYKIWLDDHWSEPYPITSDSEAHHYGAGAIVDSEGTVWVTYERGGSGYEDIWYKTSVDNGGTWSAGQQITFAAGSENQPRIVEYFGTICVFYWTGEGSATRDIWYLVSEDYGSTWGEPKQLTTDPNLDNHVWASQIGMELWVVWRTDRSGNPDIWLAKTSPSPLPPLPCIGIIDSEANIFQERIESLGFSVDIIPAEDVSSTDFTQYAAVIEAEPLLAVNNPGPPVSVEDLVENQGVNVICLEDGIADIALDYGGTLYSPEHRYNIELTDNMHPITEDYEVGDTFIISYGDTETYPDHDYGIVSLRNLPTDFPLTKLGQPQGYDNEIALGTYAPNGRLVLLGMIVEWKVGLITEDGLNLFDQAILWVTGNVVLEEQELQRLHTDGRYIKDEAGNVVHLYGVNKPGLEWAWDDFDGDGEKEARIHNENDNSEYHNLGWIVNGQAEVNGEDWNSIKSWGCNVIRLGFQQEWWEESEDYREIIDKSIEESEKFGMYTILDNHWTNDKDKQQTGHPEDWTSWKDMWVNIAERYIDKTSLLFDIWNEPHNISDSEWRNEAQECVNRIRNAGNDAIILISSTDWGHGGIWWAVGNPITGGNIAYTLHWYQDWTPGPSSELGIKMWLFVRGWWTITKFAPVITGEFNVANETAALSSQEAWMRNFCSVMDDWDIHFLGWGWYPEEWTDPPLWEFALLQADGGSWITPSKGGEILIEEIAKAKLNDVVGGSLYIGPMLAITAYSPVTIIVTDPSGVRVGYDSAIRQVVNEIGGAAYSGPETEPQVIAIPTPPIGVYVIDIFGAGTGEYTIAIESMAEDGTVTDSETWTSETSLGELDRGSVQLFGDGSLVGRPHGVIPEVPWGTIVASAAMIFALVAYVAMPKWKRKQ